MHLPAICLFLYACVALYLRSVCWRDPTSIFFDPERAHAPGYSAVRINQAESYAENELLESTPAKWDRASRPMICVGMASVERNGVSYLKSTIGSLQEGLSREERGRLYFVVLLAHTDQTQHPEVAEPWLSEAADALPSYHDDVDRLRLAQEMELSDMHNLKAKFDYSIVLEECAKANPQFTLVVEDDVVALDGWYHRALQALGDASSRTVEMGHMSFLYLRLFYYEALMGWNSEEWSLYLHNCVTLVVIEIVLILVVRSFNGTARKPYGAPRRPLFDKTTTFLLLIFTPMCIALFFAAGRNCMLPHCHGVALMPKYACCGQGLMYPQERVINDLIPLFRDARNSTMPTDSFIEEYADQHDELRWAVTPVLLQHVGGKSSHGALRSTYGDLSANWLFNFGFEANNAEALAEEHQVAIKGG